MAADPDLLTRVRRVRASLAESGPVTGRSEGDFDRVAVPSDDGDVLRDVLLAERARVVIEVGLAYGASALAIAEALVTRGEARHVIIDAFQDRFGEAGWDALARAGVEGMCVLLRERSQLALPRLVTEGFVADAAFVDGSHLFHNVFVDLFFLRELLRPGGVVILDDCQWPSFAAAVRYFETNTRRRYAPIIPEPTFRAYRLPDPPSGPA